VPFTVSEIAGWVGGTASGATDTPVTRAVPLADAGPGDLTYLDGVKRLKEWQASKATAAVVPADFPEDSRPLIRAADPLGAFAKIILTIRGDRPVESGIHPTASIHPTATLGANPTVGPYAVVGAGTTVGANVRIHAGAVVGRFCTLGDDVTLFPRVVIYDDCKLGHRVAVHAGTVIGADGFGYRLVKGRHTKVPQIGGVELGDDVEVGANSTIDSGTFGPTRIGTGTKIDNLVMISHNCQIGKHCLLAAQVGIAGSTTTGDYTVLAGQVGVADHVHIGSRAVLAAQTGVIGDVPDGATLVGFPAMPGREFMKCAAEWKRAGGVRKDVARIKKHLGLSDEEKS
jgi:UDP-3-O-[3-hydroxymyristoyl] glucosamine N-acyltransferase